MTAQTVADAGRVIAGSARGIRLGAPGAGTRPIADRVKQTLFAILEPELRGARVPRPVRGQRRRRDRGAVARRRARDLRRAGPGRAPRSSPRTSRGPTSAGPRRADRPGRSSRWLRDPDGRDAAAPFDVVLVDPPYAETELLRPPRGRSAPLLAPGAPGRRQALLARPAAGRVGLLASDRERRFGETDADVLPARGGRWTTVAVYPGSFDPITNGHLDIVTRAAAVFDRVIVAVLANPRKSPLLPVETRIGVIARARATAGVGRRPDRGRGLRRADRRPLPGARRRRHRPRPARDQRLRDRDAARPQQPGPRAGGRHRLLHDLGRATATSARAWSRRSRASAATSRRWSRPPRRGPGARPRTR